MAEDRRTPERKRQDETWGRRHDTQMTDCATESRTKLTDTAHGKVKTTETTKRDSK